MRYRIGFMGIFISPLCFPMVHVQRALNPRTFVALHQAARFCSTKQSNIPENEKADIRYEIQQDRALYTVGVPVVLGGLIGAVTALQDVDGIINCCIAIPLFSGYGAGIGGAVGIVPAAVVSILPVSDRAIRARYEREQKEKSVQQKE